MTPKMRPLKGPIAILGLELHECDNRRKALKESIDNDANASPLQLKALRVACTSVQTTLRTFTSQIDAAEASCSADPNAKENFLRSIVTKIRDHADDPAIIKRICKHIGGFLGDSKPSGCHGKALLMNHFLKSSTKIFLAAFDTAERSQVHNWKDFTLLLSIVEQEEPAWPLELKLALEKLLAKYFTRELEDLIDGILH